MFGDSFGAMMILKVQPQSRRPAEPARTMTHDDKRHRTTTSLALLDAAVAAVYGWDAKLFDDEALQALPTLNLAGKRMKIDDAPDEINLTLGVARDSVRNVRKIVAPTFRPYKEMGSVEGYLQSVSLDGNGRRILNMTNRVTEDDVKCIVTGDACRDLERRDIGDVWRRRRVSVFGIIHYKGPLKISQIEATSIRFFKNRNELPDIEDIIDPDFTGGLRSEEYLERLRDGKLS